MNRNELIASIAKTAKLNKKQAGAALEATISAIGDAMKRGQKVAIVGFGTFGTAVRKARKGINPKTKQVIKIASKRIPKFKAGKSLKDLVSRSK